MVAPKSIEKRPKEALELTIKRLNAESTCRPRGFDKGSDSKISPECKPENKVESRCKYGAGESGKFSNSKMYDK